MQTYRLFIAATLPHTVMDALVALQDRVRRDNHPVTWVARESMHLTLMFLGETDARLVGDLGAAIRAALMGQIAIPLHLIAVGAFPNLRRPQVVWAGVGGDTQALARAQAGLDAALGALGLARETRPFRAHLTLGRVWHAATPQQQERLGTAIRALPPPESAAWLLDRVVLFRSEPGRDGPVYTELDAVQIYDTVA